MDIWAPKSGDSDLEVTPEEKKEHDKLAAAIYHDKRAVGHAPKNLGKQILSVFVIAKLFHQL